VVVMKKLMAAILSLALIAATALPAVAQGRNRNYSNQTQARRYDNNRQQRTYYDYSGRDNRSFWEKHRDKITTVGGVLGGAILGSIIGGKKGAAIGAIAGGGGAAVYTYKIRNKNRRY
jgi:hypothetical protein